MACSGGTSGEDAELEPTATVPPDPTPTPQVGFGPGTYQVGEDIRPGIYAGRAGTGLLDSCYWSRLKGVSGDFSDLIANDNATGQFYVEVLNTDAYFKTDCVVTPLDTWPEPDMPISKIEPGTYLIGRDISPGTYRGKAGVGAMESCYWSRLSGVSGDFSDLIANDNAIGSYFVSVQDSDYALSTRCTLELTKPPDPTPASTPLLMNTPTPTAELEPTATMTQDPTPASTPLLMNTPTPTAELEPTATVTPDPTPTPQVGFSPGTYQVGEDIRPGIYAGRAGTGLLDSCYWSRLKGVSGDFSDLIANDNATGQFYVEVLNTDAYFKTDCVVTPLDTWPEPDMPISKIEPGTYLIGRDISPGTYRGKAGVGAMESCYWSRLSGVSGDFSDLIANDNAIGSYFVSVQDSDYALSTRCTLELTE